MRFLGTSRGYRVQNVSLTYTAPLLIAAGVNDRTFPVPGLMAGQTCSIEPYAPPAQYALHNCWCATNGVLTVRMTTPLLALGASFNLACKLIVYD